MAKHKHSVYDEPTYQKFWSSPGEREYAFLSYYLKKFQHFGKAYIPNAMERFQLLPILRQWKEIPHEQAGYIYQIATIQR